MAVQRNLVAIADIPVLIIWRYLWSFDDQQPFGGQGGEDRGGVHFHRKPEEHKEGGKITRKVFPVSNKASKIEITIEFGSVQIVLDL